MKILNRLSLDHALSPVCGRLTLTSGVPLTNTDVIGSTTIYFTPFAGNTIPLFNTVSSNWDIIPFSEKNISITSLSPTNAMYDMFANYDNAGGFTLSTTAWTSVSARATSIVYFEGVLVKNGSNNFRYLGSFATNATGGQTDDTKDSRLVWNMHNRIPRKMFATDSNTAVYSRTSTPNLVDYCRASVSLSPSFQFVLGLGLDIVQLMSMAQVAIASGSYGGSFLNVSLSSSSTVATRDYFSRIGNTTMEGGAFSWVNYPPTQGGLYLVTMLEGIQLGTVTFAPALSGISGVVYG